MVGEIGPGLLVLAGVAKTDSERDADYVAKKIAGLRVFNDDEGRMNRSVVEVGGGVLIVSQFTLYGDPRKGMRPSFDTAAPPEQARRIYDYLVAEGCRRVPRVETGIFQSSMAVSLVNDGPVTILCDSPMS